MTWLARIIAIVLCAAALDAAATAIRGPQAMLLASGAAAGLAVFSIAVFWRWAAVAAALTLVWLTSAFAAGTVLLGSPDAPGAAAFTGLTPGDSATLVLILVLGAAAILGIATFKPLAVRLIIALVALYALVPMALSVGHGGLRAAMTDGALAQLRGAYVGVVVLALGTVVALGAAIFFLVKRRGAKAATALVLACAIVLASGTGAYVAAAAGLPSFVAVHRSATPDATLAAASTPQAAETLVRFAQTAPAENFDLAAREKQLTTAEAAFAYVRDSIGFEPYVGVLRGPQGTFLTRAGNALDRSMLLAHVLKANNISVRYVTGHLGVPQAEQLFARAFETKTEAPPAAPAPNPAAKALRDRILARGAHDYDVIRAALGNAVPPAAATSHDDAVKEIAQHAWIQAQLKGQWVDLDPSFSDATPGHAYATVENTYDSLPPSLMQHVTIRVSTETLRDGKLVKDVAVESTAPAYQLLDRQVFLFHSRPPGFKGILSSKEDLAPILVVDGVLHAGKPIAFSAGASAAATEPPSGINGAIGALGGSTGTNAAFVAESLELEVAFPDGRHDVVRRMLVDRGGTAWRSGATLDAARLKDLPRDKNGVIATQTLYNLCFSAGRHDLPGYSRAVATLLNGEIPRFESTPPEKMTFNEQAWPFAMRGFGWFVASDHLIVPSLNDTPGLRFYADSPRIFVFGAAAGSGATALAMESDLRRDSLRALVRDASVQSAVAQHRLRFGALEGALEHEMTAAGDTGALATTSKLTESGGVTVYRPGSSGTIAATDPETAARIRAAVDSGGTLIVPNRVLAGGVPGWWEITRDGDARPILDDLGGGRGGYGGGGPVKSRPPGLPKQGDPFSKTKTKGAGGGELAEYGMEVAEAVNNMPVFVQVGLVVGEVAALAAALLAAAGAL